LQIIPATSFVVSETLHYYITLETIYSGLSKKNFKDHYADAATEQCMGMIVEINTFSVSDEMS